MSNSVAAGVAGFLSGRNRIINGCFRVQQWAANADGVSIVLGPFDRWQIGNSAGGTLSQTASTITYNGVGRPALRQTATVANTGVAGTALYQGIWHKPEGYNVFDLLGQVTSLSFIFNSNVSGNFSVAIGDYAGSQTYVTTFAYTAGAPKYYSFLIPAIPTNASIPNSNAGGMMLRIGAVNTGTYQGATSTAWQAGIFISAPGGTNWGASAGNFIEIAEVQYEAGPIATPFERRSYGQELALCQRYFWKSYPITVAAGTASQDSSALEAWTGPTADANSYVSVQVIYPVSMRAAPTITTYNPHTGTIGTAYAQNAATSLTCGTGNVTERGAFVDLQNQSVAARDIIKFHFTAQAEL